MESALEDFDHLEEEERNRATANAAAAAAAAAAGPATDSSTAPSPPPSAEQKEGDGEGEDDADLDNLPPELMDGLKKLVEELSINKEGGAGVPGDLGLGSEEMMKEALEQLEGSPEFASIMEKMMGSLLSKEVLYEPIKQMKEKYPAWLANNRDKVSAEEFARYSKQFEYVQRLCVLYESDSTMAEIMNVMQEMQEHGQPPEDIVQEMAPGFNLGAEGGPQMPELEELLKGMEGLPDMGEGKDKCLLM